MLSISPNCWNEHDELKTVLVCSPSSMDVPDQRTADFVQWEKPVSQKKAQENFEQMVGAMKNEGTRVIDYSTYLSNEHAQLNNQLINRVFVRDLACVFGNKIIPGDAGTSMRIPEYLHSHNLFKSWFPKEIFDISDNNELKAMEYGDSLVLNKDSIFLNTGMRTSIESVEALKNRIFQSGFSEIGVIDLPRRGDTLHLDMNCNVIGSQLLIAKSYMRFFPVQVLTDKDETRYVMMEEFLNRQGFEVLWTDDVKHTVADVNFLNLNPETLLVSTKANKKILKHPKLKGKKIVEVEVDELEKGGGGIRCMTLPFERK